MVWLLGTMSDGSTLEYAIPMDEPFLALGRDAEKFVTLEVLRVEYV